MSSIVTKSQLTLIETAKRISPSGDLMAIAEVLNQDNEFLTDAVYTEANDTFSNKTVRRGSLPTGSWRKLNAGVATESTQTIEVIDTIGMLESYSEPDKDLVDSQPNPRQFRSDEDMGFVEGLSQTLAATGIYGNALTDPEQFTGLAPRLASIAATKNVINEGGTGSDLSSIFIVQWGLRAVHMIYPRNSPFVGIKHRDLGEATKYDGSGNPYQIYRTHFQIKCGMVVRNPKNIARLANIETTGTTNTFDENNLITLLNRMPGAGKGAVLYVNDTIKTQMEIALKDKNNIWYSADSGEGLAGVPILRFRGCPIRMVDQMVITESALT